MLLFELTNDAVALLIPDGVLLPKILLLLKITLTGTGGGRRAGVERIAVVRQILWKGDGGVAALRRGGRRRLGLLGRALRQRMIGRA